MWWLETHLLSRRPHLHHSVRAGNEVILMKFVGVCRVNTERSASPLDFYYTSRTFFHSHPDLHLNTHIDNKY